MPEASTPDPPVMSLVRRDQRLRGPLHLTALCERLPARQDQQFWRSLGELADGEALRACVQQELPSFASAWHDPVSRRRFLQLMGASLALAGLNACTRQTEEHIVPYARSPDALMPGRPLFFATALPLSGFTTGARAESHMGLPGAAHVISSTA